MKLGPLICASVSACSLLLGACAGPQAPAPVTASTLTTADWKAGEYAVSFRAGPVVDSGARSFSSYEISRTLIAGDSAQTVVAESAFSIDSFRSGYAKNPERYIRLFTSSSGKTLLIEEKIPNDCDACTNWILVRGEGDRLTCVFLALPYRTIRLGDPISGEGPAITRVSEHEVSFCYSDGTRQTVAVKDVVKKEQRPEFPG